MSAPVWEELGIAPTADKAAIRRAYAARMKEQRPEEDRDRFIRLREAYEKALAGEAAETVVFAKQPAEAMAATAARPTQAPPPPLPQTAMPEIFQFGSMQFHSAPVPAKPVARSAVKAKPPSPLVPSAPWRLEFDIACSSGDVETALPVFDRLQQQHELSLSDSIYCSDQLLGLLSRDKLLPISRIKQIADRFGWYRNANASAVSRDAHEIARQRLCRRLDAEYWHANVRERAEAGDAQMQYRLGQSYDKKGKSEQEQAEALRWLELAARQGHAGAQHHIGLAHEKGIGTAQNYERAAHWYGEALGNGSTLSAVYLGKLVLAGNGVKQDHAEARRLYEIGLASNNDVGRNKLADLLRRGEGGPVDAPRSRELFGESARNNNTYALVTLGDMHAKGEGGPKDDVRAAECYRSAALVGSMVAQYRLGTYYLSGCGVEKDGRAAREWLRKAYAQDHGEAGFCLAYTLMHYGEGDAERVEALGVFAALAEKGMSKAQYELGRAYRNGLGTPVDLQAGFTWYLRAAQNGNVLAMNIFGWALLHGTPLQQDIAGGWRWLARAAEGGQPNAMHTLGSIYEAGTIVKQDLVRACLWYKLAAINYEATNEKVAEAKQLAETVGAKLSPQLLARIDSEIAAFKPKDWSTPQQT